MIDDLKNYKAPDAFSLDFTEGELAVLLACTLALGFILSTF